ncbi:MAG: YkgJ family cysteine cluster protein [Acidobacteriaceae bacterium]|nr:YkgJ family cysteine cluster protein [Acidobacteriaceae bacterium]
MLEPSKVGEAARRREVENMRFRTFLKNYADEDTLDAQFLALHNELFAEYDCCQCANCCREGDTPLREGEALAIATFLGLSEREFSERHLTESDEGCMLAAPCRFLQEDGGCAIEDCMPGACREFPYTNKPERIGSLLGVVSSAEVCPIVFEMLQRLKGMYGFRTRR